MASQYDDQTKLKTGYPAVAAAAGYNPSAPSGVYPGYTNASNGYPYAAAPPASYYNNNAYSRVYYESGPYGMVGRLVIVMIIALVMMGVIFFFVVLIFHPRDPIINIDTLSVSNFTIIDSRLNADWDISFKILNPNTKLDMECNEVDVLIFYKRDLLSTSSMKPLLLQSKNEKRMNGTLVSRQDFVENDMEEDKKDGNVVLSVRLRLVTRFQNGNAVTKDQKLTVLCENLKLYFEGDTGNGKLNPGSWGVCLVYEL